MTKNSNPTTRHKPLTSGRIKEDASPKDLKDILAESVNETTTALMEMYDVPSTVGGSKESQKLQDFSQNANEYHYNKRMSEHHHKIGGDYEEEHGETPMGHHHYHMGKAHEFKMQHHADQLVKEHGVDRGKLAHLAWKHRDSAHDFTLALAQEGKEPLKQAKSNRGKWHFKK